ncbi:helix-turn-helix domain-containing protein [Marispirochaeta sp.]|uniref:helix-turn-helix domain-containing protein n=1 Tax=Marispirochaeta sp. TaxID=2038653 RepID=UPI0029C79E30|nr:helix-turn-helix domain-containing protein [Marispirochaeta sp.]
MARLIDYAAAAERTGVKPQTLRAWVSQRRIPHIKLGRRCLFDSEELDRWIDERRVPAGSRR